MVPFISVCIVHIQYSGVDQSTYNPAGWNGMERTDCFFFELFVRGWVPGKLVSAPSYNFS